MTEKEKTEEETDAELKLISSLRGIEKINLSHSSSDVISQTMELLYLALFEQIIFKIVSDKRPYSISKKIKIYFDGKKEDKNCLIKITINGLFPSDLNIPAMLQTKSASHKIKYTDNEIMFFTTDKKLKKYSDEQAKIMKIQKIATAYIKEHLEELSEDSNVNFEDIFPEKIKTKEEVCLMLHIVDQKITHVTIYGFPKNSGTILSCISFSLNTDFVKKYVDKMTKEYTNEFRLMTSSKQSFFAWLNDQESQKWEFYELNVAKNLVEENIAVFKNLLGAALQNQLMIKKIMQGEKSLPFFDHPYFIETMNHNCTNNIIGLEIKGHFPSDFKIPETLRVTCDPSNANGTIFFTTTLEKMEAYIAKQIKNKAIINVAANYIKRHPEAVLEKFKINIRPKQNPWNRFNVAVDIDDQGIATVLSYSRQGKLVINYNASFTVEKEILNTWLEECRVKKQAYKNKDKTEIKTPQCRL